MSIALGAGLRENPVVGRDNIPLFLLPSVSYYGKRFSLENFNFAYLLAENQRHSLSLVSLPALEYMYFNDWSLGSTSFDDSGSNPVEISSFTDNREQLDNDVSPAEPSLAEPPPRVDVDDLHKRNLALLAGLEYGLYAGPVYFGLQWLQDLSHVHEGQEVRAAASYEWHYGNNLLRTSAGLLWKSHEAMDYYYGIRADEVEDTRLVYEASAGASYFARISWQKKLSKHWSLNSAVYYRKMSDAAAASPIVDKDYISSVFFGGAYHF